MPTITKVPLRCSFLRLSQLLIGIAYVGYVVVMIILVDPKSETQTGFLRNLMSLSVHPSLQSENYSTNNKTTRRIRRRKRPTKQLSSKWKQSNKLLMLCRSI